MGQGFVQREIVFRTNYTYSMVCIDNKAAIWKR